MTNPLSTLLPKLRSAVAAMERLNYTDETAVLRSGLDWVSSDSGGRRSLTAGDMRTLLVEVEALQRDLNLRNEQIDGYERQLGIHKAGAEHTIGSEIERLRKRNERICGIIARLNTAEGLSAAALSGLQRMAAAASDAPSDETPEAFRLTSNELLARETAAALAHRACCGTEHDPPNGKLHGYCIVCGVPWPCETAQHYLRVTPEMPRTGKEAAWHAVWEELKKHHPKFFEVEGSGIECVIKEIQRLQALDRRV